jgi:hypothetical protein
MRSFTRGKAGPWPQTFKSINPLLPVLLLHENPADPLPPGVDAVVTPTLIGEKLELLLAQAP